MSYEDATYLYLRDHGGGPRCPICGQEMFAEDDHGCFRCSCNGRTFDVVSKTFLGVPPPIPQVDTSKMSDAEKAQIPPIHRLKSPPTTAEAEFFNLLMRGPDCMDDPAYWDAVKAVERERGI